MSASAGKTDGKLRAAASEVDITADFGWMRTGFAVKSPIRALHGRLRAHILVLDDGCGQRVALIAVDLHAGTRLLTDLVASKLASLHPALGLDARRLVITGTHTHSGPWRIYGSPFYDANAWSALSGTTHARIDVVEGMADRIVAGVAAASQALAPARVGIGAALAVGLVRNRSLGAALQNGLAWPTATTTAAEALAADEAAVMRPPLSKEQMAARCLAVVRTFTGARDDAGGEDAIIDRRVRAVWAEALDGTPIGAHLTFAAHNAMLPAECDVGSADFFGWAGRMLSERLRRGGSRPQIGFAAGSTGDSDPRPETPWLAQWPVVLRDRSAWKHPDDEEGPRVLAWVKSLAEQLSEVGFTAIQDARARLVDRLPIECRYVEWGADEERPPATLFPASALKKADVHGTLTKASVGWPTAGGSELGRSWLYGAVHEGGRGPFVATDPQSPKLRSAAVDVVPRHPFHLVRLGETWLVGLPGEPTTFFARSMAEAVDPADPSRPIIFGVCGDYRGYLTTPHEFVAQHYEGSSTIFGRHTARWYFHWLRRAVSDPPKPTSYGICITGDEARSSIEQQDLHGFRRRPAQGERADVALHVAGVSAQPQLLDTVWRGRLPLDVTELRAHGLCTLRAFEGSRARAEGEVRPSFETSDREGDGILSFTEHLFSGDVGWRWRVLLPKPVAAYAKIEVSVREWHGAPTEHRGELVNRR